MSYSFGNNFKITLFGQSHSKEIGIVIDGVKTGYKINYDLIEKNLDRRRPGKNKFSTSRKELDEFKIVSGEVDGITCGAPLSIIIKSVAVFSSSPKIWLEIKSVLPFLFKSSIRILISFIPSGSKPFIGSSQIRKSGFPIRDMAIPSLCFIPKEKLRAFLFPTPLSPTRSKSDSIGGIIETAILNMPIGIGEPFFDSMESVISHAIFSVPGVKGIEFGSGFEAAKMFGSYHNDSYYYDNGKVKTKTNNHGGIIGGLSTSMPIIFRTAIKPTSSIEKAQETISIKNKKVENLKINGRHDPSIVPRAVVALETMTAIAILDLVIEGEKWKI